MTTWREQQVSIMTDKLSGARGITGAVAQMLLHLLQEETFVSQTDMLSFLRQIAHELLTAQSGMASLVTLFNHVFFTISEERDPAAGAALLEQTIKRYLVEQTESKETICRKATALIPSGVSIVTHSASSTVFETILHAQRAGRNPRVFVLESRPLYEGRLLAADLAQHGISVILMIDSAIYVILQQVDLVLVGVDSLTEEGLVSKIGTAGLAVCAQTLGIPCYFVGDTSKIWPSALGKQPIHEREPKDVWEDAPAVVRVRNSFYDSTPWSAVAGVVTEHGLLTADEFRIKCRTRPVHPVLQAIITEVRSTI